MQAHIVPRFHLGRFATPPGRRGFIYVIDKRSGRTAKEPVAKTCTAEDFYALENDAGEKDMILEDMLQKVESYSAQRIERLVRNSGVTPPDDERHTLALYLVLANMRTPRMREHLRWLTNTATLQQLRSTLDADPPWQRMRAAVYPELSDEEAEQLRRSMIRSIDAGDFEIEFPDRKYVIDTMQFLVDQSYMAVAMSWSVLRAPLGTEFVIGDHAVSMYDPTVGRRGGPVGNALMSSPLAQTVLPLDRSVAVRLTVGEEHEWRDIEADPALVQEINLRTYAWAETEVYGSSQARVVAVREYARMHPAEMLMFKPHRGSLLMENDYPLVTGGHRRDVQIFKPT